MTQAVTTFLFNAAEDGSCALTFIQPGLAPTHGSARLKKNAPVDMVLDCPLGSLDPIKTATLTFHEVSGQGWPFVGQTTPLVIWHPGQKELRTRAENGSWTFTAVLTSQDDRTYTVPDPELHVGDGPGDEPAR